MTTITKRIRVNESDVVSVVTMPNNPSSSLRAADKIGSCDDLITEIMLRLPEISLIRFKSVSKRWYSLISDPTFNQLFQKHNPNPPASGLYALVKNPQKQHHYFIPFDVENRSRALNLNLNFDPDDLGTTRVVHSCNGLTLCSRQFWNGKVFTIDDCYVCNPTINQFTMLPKHEIFNENYRCGMTLAFDPWKSPYYKIVSVRNIGKDDYSIGIYNSQTYSWKDSCRCTFAFRVSRPLNTTPGVYWNNAFHWLRQKYLIYFNLDEEVVRTIPTSFRCASSHNMFESRDHLLFVERDSSFSWKLKIHELKRDYSEWIVKYHVDLHQIGPSFPEALDYGLIRFRVLSVVLGEKEEDESFFVLSIGDAVVRFNLVAETFYKLPNFIAHTKLVSEFPHACQFIASLCSV
ncbi:F-box protein At5g07610-like [Rutidosis leptorrhynchoides]|uniref:F-box protein At5g07610-like n=1 Tax=Rutidosis leptorrhynchoides TaxID=125765 RepID=UPI003A9A27D9